MPDEEDGQLPAETHELCQSNPVSEPVSLKAGVEGLESLIEQFYRSQYGTAQTSKDKGKGVADLVAEPGHVIHGPAETAKYRNSNVCRVVATSHPTLTIAQPSHFITVGEEKGKSYEAGYEEIWTGAGDPKKKTAVTLTLPATVQKTESSSDAQPEVVINQVKSGNAKENLKRPVMKSDQPSDRSPKRAKATQRMEKSPKPKSMASVLKSTGRFKIPLRPQENQPRSEIHQGVEGLSVMSRCYANDRDQLEDRRRYDQDRHAEEKYHRRPDRRRYGTQHPAIYRLPFHQRYGRF